VLLLVVDLGSSKVGCLEIIEEPILSKADIITDPISFKYGDPADTGEDAAEEEGLESGNGTHSGCTDVWGRVSCATCSPGGNMA
jgi:hypothetical protein